MDWDKNTIKKILGIITFTVFLLWALNNYGVVFSMFSYTISLLFPFILGACMAFVLNTPMKSIEAQFSKIGKNKKSFFHNKVCRPLSIVTTYLLLFGIVALVLFTVIPEIGRTFNGLLVNIQNFFIEMEDTIKQWTDISVDWLEQIETISINWNEIWNIAKNWVSKGAGSVLSSTIGATTAAFGTIVNLALGFVFSIYVLLQKEKLGVQSKKLLYSILDKKKADSAVEITQMANITFSNFLTGQCLEAVILGVLFFITMSIFQFPYAMIISILIGFLALIPIFGAFIGCAIGTFLIVVVNPVKAFWFLVLFLVLQQLEGNLIYPRVVGNSVGLPSIWVLVAVTLGANMMGIVGMLIFIPIFSIIYTLLRRFTERRLRERKIKIE